MPDLQHPDIAGNYLSSYYKAHQQRQADENNDFNRQRLVRQDARTEQQFEQEYDLNKINKALKLAEAQAQIFSQLPDGNPQALEAAKQQFSQQFGVPIEQMANVTVDRLPALRIQSGQTLKELQIMAQRANINQSNAAARASDALASARSTIGVGRGGGFGRPMTSGVQGKEDEDIADIHAVQSVNTQIDNVLGQIKSGDLTLGPLSNLASRGQNFAGASTPGSRAFAEFEATLEKMRNDSLRLNKGVQTEGDAQRAWNEVTKYITDENVVATQLRRIKALNAIAAKQRLQRINIRRARNGYPEFDPAEIGYGAGVQAQQQPVDDYSDLDEILGLK